MPQFTTFCQICFLCETEEQTVFRKNKKIKKEQFQVGKTNMKVLQTSIYPREGGKGGRMTHLFYERERGDKLSLQKFENPSVVKSIEFRISMGFCPTRFKGQTPVSITQERRHVRLVRHNWRRCR